MQTSPVSYVWPHMYELWRHPAGTRGVSASGGIGVFRESTRFHAILVLPCMWRGKSGLGPTRNVCLLPSLDVSCRRLLFSFAPTRSAAPRS